LHGIVEFRVRSSRFRVILRAEAGLINHGEKNAGVQGEMKMAGDESSDVEGTWCRRFT
jgi:hypothetical protein